MRKFLIVVMLVALAVGLHVRYNGWVMPKWPWAKSIKDQPPTKENAIAHLSSMVDEHINSIFAPLDGAMPPMSVHSLSKLRALLADGAAGTTGTEQLKYKTAVQLCDTLLSAIKERESCNVRLASSRTKPFAAGLSQNQVNEERTKREFFEGAIALSWAQTSQTYRERTNKLYQSLRQQERSGLSVSAK